MPEAAAGLNMSAIAGVDHIVLKVSGAVLGSPHFFGEQPDFLAFDAPQSVEMKEHEYVMRLPVSEGLEPWPARLKGVLAYTDSVGKYHGRRVDLPISRGGNAATRNESGASAQVRDASPAAGSMVGTLLFALLGGLVLNLMPCVFPVLGIKVLGFVNQAGNDRLQVRSHGLVFTAGVLLSFWALVGLLAFLRAAGVGLGWGFQLQSPEFVFALVLIIFVFGLNLSGAFEFGTTLTGIGGRLHLRLGYAGSFFSGVLATVVATPCSAPFLAPALAVALSLPLLQSFLVFTAIALGLSLPYLLLSCFPQALSHLPRAGRWMETFKQAMAFPLYATAAYLLWVLGGQTQEDAYLTSLLGLAVVAMGVWLYGRYSRNGSARPQIGRVAGVLLVAAGTYMGWPHEAQAAVTWEPWSAARVAELRAEQRPIYVDFTARWCATCQANKKLVFSSKAVLEMFAARKVAALKADWTNQDPHITQELQKWHRGAVPFDLVYRSGAAEPTVLPEVLTPGIVLEAIQ
jgi:thiol:disulfide interchange protein DsbD